MTEALASALARSAAALDAGDAAGAAATAGEAMALCDALRARGTRLDRAALDALAALHARCQAAAAAERERLTRALEAIGTARRAAAAYGG